MLLYSDVCARHFLGCTGPNEKRETERLRKKELEAREGKGLLLYVRGVRGDRCCAARWTRKARRCGAERRRWCEDDTRSARGAMCVYKLSWNRSRVLCSCSITECLSSSPSSALFRRLSTPTRLSCQQQCPSQLQLKRAHAGSSEEEGGGEDGGGRVGQV
jgi:hypothetical protein